MISIVALSLAALAPVSVPYVTGLSVVPVADRTEVVIEVDGAVTTSDFALSGPARLVLDMTGLSGIEPVQHRIGRGGVRSLRLAQLDANIARIVIDLDTSVEYRVERTATAITVSFHNTAGKFEPWRTDLAGPAPAVSAPVPEAAAAPAAAVVATVQLPPISVTFIEEPLASVLAAFAEFADHSIVASADVKAKVITAEIRDQPWDIALDAILSANGLHAKELESGVILVQDGATLVERQQEEPLVSRRYDIRYVNADSLVKAVTGMVSAKGKVVANASSNALLVTDVPSTLDRIEPIIQDLDQRVPQVNIAATIAFVDRTALEQLGVTYDVKDSRGNQLNQRFPGWLDEDGDNILDAEEATSDNVILLGGNSIAALGNANHPVPNPALQLLSSLVLGRHTLITFLEALQSVTLSDIQAKPVVTVMNHRQAEIQVGQRTPIRVIDAGALAGENGQAARATVDFQNTGVILRVTPHVTGNQVLLDMHAERSDAIPAPGDIGFVFTTQNATTQVLVNDGETAVIGGLTITEKSRVRTGIPLLMDLPVIGALFRNTREQENKRDLLIMVTPHIVRN
ncbi:MAG: secretin N-terminal domain-containing protein [Longimicrobiales bacterium]